MKKNIIAYILSILCPFFSVAQKKMGTRTTDLKEIHLAIGANRVSLIDEAKSPLIYTSGYIPALKFGYGRSTAHSLYGADLFMSYGGFGSKNHSERFITIGAEDVDGKGTDNQIPLQGNIIYGELSAFYLKRLNPVDARSGFYLGGKVFDHIFYPTGSINSGNPTNVASLAVNAKFNYTLSNKHAIGLGASTSLLALITRDPFDGTYSEPDRSLQGSFFSKGSKLRSLGGYQEVMLNLDYMYSISKKMELMAIAEAGWQHTALPTKFNALNTTILLQLNYKLGHSTK